MVEDYRRMFDEGGDDKYNNYDIVDELVSPGVIDRDMEDLYQNRKTDMGYMEDDDYCE